MENARMENDQTEHARVGNPATGDGLVFVLTTIAAMCVITLAAALMLELAQGDGFAAWLFAPVVLAAVLLGGAVASAATAPRTGRASADEALAAQERAEHREANDDGGPA